MVKKVILGVLGVVVALVVILCVVASMQKADFVITRSALINAPTDKVFPLVNDFHNWDQWSPWAKKDPNMKTTYSGPDSGVGASYAWSGNSEVGEGKMTIKSNHPPKQIVIDLEFSQPFLAKNIAGFDFKAEGEKTNVAWSMAGKKNFMMKLFCLVFDMDKEVGGDFEKGLAQMKTVAEAASAQ